jgi:hypothetical protein
VGGEGEEGEGGEVQRGPHAVVAQAAGAVFIGITSIFWNTYKITRFNIAILVSIGIMRS